MERPGENKFWMEHPEAAGWLARLVMVFFLGGGGEMPLFFFPSFILSGFFFIRLEEGMGGGLGGLALMSGPH